MKNSDNTDQVDWSIFTDDCRETISLSEKIASFEKADCISEVHFIRAFYSVFAFSNYTFINPRISSMGISDQIKAIEVISRVPFRWRVGGILKHAFFLSQNFGLNYVGMACLLRAIHDIFDGTQYYHLIENLEIDIKKLNSHLLEHTAK